MTKNKEKENIFGKMVIIIQEILKTIYSMEKGNIIMQMDNLDMMVNIFMIKEMEQENIFIKIKNIIQVDGNEVSSMEQEYIITQMGNLNIKVNF